MTEWIWLDKPMNDFRTPELAANRTKQLPIRVQLSRKKGWRIPPNTVNVTRPHRWGNPWKVGEMRFDSALGSYRAVRDIADAIDAFRQSINWTPEWGQGYGPTHRNLTTARVELCGKNLACWCALDQPCHADVLLEIANQ